MDVAGQRHKGVKDRSAESLRGFRDLEERRASGREVAGTRSAGQASCPADGRQWAGQMEAWEVPPRLRPDPLASSAAEPTSVGARSWTNDTED